MEEVIFSRVCSWFLASFVRRRTILFGLFRKEVDDVDVTEWVSLFPLRILELFVGLSFQKESVWYMFYDTSVSSRCSGSSEHLLFLWLLSLCVEREEESWGRFPWVNDEGMAIISWIISMSVFFADLAFDEKAVWSDKFLNRVLFHSVMSVIREMSSPSLRWDVQVNVLWLFSVKK